MLVIDRDTVTKDPESSIWSALPVFLKEQALVCSSQTVPTPEKYVRCLLPMQSAKQDWLTQL